MTITAKYPGTCPACGGAIRAGDEVEWERGQKARHSTCPEVAAAEPVLHRNPEARTARRNARPGECFHCRADVAAGAGHLAWCEDGSIGYCRRHFDEGGWEVVCADLAACQARAKAGHEAAVAAKAEREAEAAKVATAVAAETARLAAEFAALIAPYPDHTNYVGDYYYAGRAAAAGELVFSVPRERYGAVRVPVHEAYRVPEGVVTIFLGHDLGTRVVTLYATREVCDAFRLASVAAKSEWKPGEAEAGLASEHVGDDQRRMYELVVEREKGA